MVPIEIYRKGKKKKTFILFKTKERCHVVAVILRREKSIKLSHVC
jgi:hypothetical protein